VGYALFVIGLFLSEIIFAQTPPAIQANDPSVRKLPVLELKDSQYQYILGSHMEILEDEQSNLTLAKVVSKEYDTLFRPSTKAIPNFGYIRSDFWFRLQVRNAAIQPDTHWLLEVAYPLIDHLELYIFYADGTYRVKRGGDMYPFSEREIKYQNLVFDLELSDPNVRTIYMHSSGRSSKQFPFYIWESLHFFEHMHREDMLWGIYFGTLLVMILYNLLLFISIRNFNYFYYVLYISGFTLVQLSLSGYAFQFLWPDYPLIANISNVIFIGFTLSFGMLFSISLLNIREILPKALPLMYGLTLLGLMMALLAIANLLDYPSRFSALLALICSITLFIVGLVVLKKGYRPARFYMIAWTALLLGLILYVAKSAGLLPISFLTEHSIQIGSVMELILLSLGLGDSINSMKREREKAQMEVILALQENERIKDAINQRLEQKVLERTKEITKQNQELEVLNATKDKFFSIVAHDLKGPLNSMTGFFDLLANHTEALSLQEIQGIAKNLGESIENTTKLTDNLLTWAMAQMNTLKHQPQCVDLNRVINEGVTFFKESCKKKQIELQLHMQPELFIFADENHVQFILRNLISNALKFTPPGGTITISTSIENTILEIAIADNGVGMSDEVLNKIFRIDSKHTTEGTAGEKGTGLGLLLCKEFVERNQGKLWAKSEPGKGSTFFFAFELLVEKKDLV
jgi:signal transduction histidine kinase